MASPALTHFLPRFGVAAAVAGVLSLTGCQNFNAQDTLPPTSGVQPLKGLAQNVSVRRNAMGMPLIESNSFHDALFSLGYWGGKGAARIEGGTGARARLDGRPAAGKTGTTQAYRDAWFVGYTGNYTAAVWFGNDDYTSTNNMTGGSLPAMTFKKLMDYAHQGIDLKPIFGIDQPMPEREEKPEVADAANPDALPPMVRPRSLSAQSTRLIRDLAARLKAADALALPGAGTAQAGAPPEITGATTR